MVNIANTVLRWFGDNFKLLSTATVAAVVYLVANASTLGLTPPEVVLLGVVPVILAATDPNRDHQNPPPAA